MSLPHLDVPGEAFAEASRFRDDFFDCLTARRDELFELADALLCVDGPVTSPVDLTLVAEHRRGHGAMYEALNRGSVDVPRLRQVLAGLPMPRAADGRLVLAVDVSNWLRPDAPTSAERLFCHVYGRSGRSSDQFVPGWPYSFVAALESGRTSWCQLLDAVRLGPEDDVAEVTAAQLRRVVTDLIEMGRWHVGDRDILIVFDAGYDAPRMAYLLDGLPVEVLGRMRSDRVMRRPTPSLKEYALSYPQGGRPPKHGKEFRFAKSETWGDPDAATTQVTDRYGTARAMAWNRIHPRLTTRSAWIEVFTQALEQIQARADAVGDIDWLVQVDSTIVRAHRAIAGTRDSNRAAVHHPVAIDRTPPVWPRRGSPIGRPAARSHTRTVASALRSWGQR
jgi:hypothetical protein